MPGQTTILFLRSSSTGIAKSETLTFILFRLRSYQKVCLQYQPFFYPDWVFFAFEMAVSSFLDRMLSHLRETSRYYTGHPKEFGPSRIINFTSERQFVQLLHEGQPVVVAFAIKCPYTKHFDSVLEEVAAEFDPNIRFMRVECPKYPAFCIARQRKDYPFIEIFHTPEEATNQTKVADTNITKYSVKVLPFNYDTSPYGFREFFKKHEMLSSDNK